MTLVEPVDRKSPVSAAEMERLRRIAAGQGIEVELRKPPVSVGTPSMGSWSMDSTPQTASGEVALGPGVRGIEIVEEMSIAEARRRWPDALEGGIDRVVKLCSYKELDAERGEWVFCALPVHGSKVRHVPGKREGA